MVQKGLSGGVKWWKEGLILDLLIDGPQDRRLCPRLCLPGSWEESDGSSPSSSYRPTPQICPPSWQWSAWSHPSIRPTIWPKKTRSCKAWWRTAPPWPSSRYCRRSSSAPHLRFLQLHWNKEENNRVNVAWSQQSHYSEWFSSVLIQFSSINLKITVLMLRAVNRVIIQSDSVKFWFSLVQ